MTSGSYINLISASAAAALPRVGDPATILGYSDRRAGTVDSVDAERGIVFVRLDHSHRTDSNGMSDAQTYRYERNPYGSISAYKYSRKKNSWLEAYRNPMTGRYVLTDSTRLCIGHRSTFYDYNF